MSPTLLCSFITGFFVRGGEHLGDLLKHSHIGGGASKTRLRNAMKNSKSMPDHGDQFPLPFVVSSGFNLGGGHEKQWGTYSIL